MPIVESQITHHLIADTSKDWFTHSVFHDISDSGFDPAVDYQNHADEIRKLFAGQDPTYPTAGGFTAGRQIRVTVYNLADAKPRPEKAVSTFAPASEDPSTGYIAHQVALRISWYAGRNLKGLRGGIYLGPMSTSSSLNARPTSTAQATALAVGHGLFDIGGENVQHVLYSEHGAPSAGIAAGGHSVLTDYWCDNAFDTIRRRKQAGTSRVAVHP